MHLISTVRTDTTIGFAAYNYIYIFVMPAMIFMSGDFSKPNVNQRAVRSSVRLLAVWLAWEGIWALIHGIIEQRPLSERFLVVPAWTLWFLVTLVTMRILLPYISRLKQPFLFSLVIALIAPLFPAIGVEFSAARTLAFLPFFVGGWVIRERGWFGRAWFQTPSARARTAAWAWLGAVAALLVVVPPLVASGRNLQEVWRLDKWLTRRDSYEWMFTNAPIGTWAPTGIDTGVVGWISFAAAGVLVSLLLTFVAATMTLALLIVVSRRQSFVSVWGARTLYVYLLHAPIVWALREAGVVEAVGSLGWVGVVALAGGALILAALLSMTWVTRVMRPVIEPRLDWLMRPKPNPS